VDLQKLFGWLAAVNLPLVVIFFVFCSVNFEVIEYTSLAGLFVNGKTFAQYE